MITPSVAKFNRVSSSIDVTSYHMANPNPQRAPPKFAGVREASFSAYKTKPANNDLVRFGKRVDFGNKMTSNQLLEAHLRAVQQQKIAERKDREKALKNEKDWL